MRSPCCMCVCLSLYLPVCIYNVTDFIKALPGNSSVNSPTYIGGQQYSRSVFYVVRAKPVTSIARKRLGKQASPIIQAVFSVGSVRSLYNDSL
jgi:hypothetical protein